MKRYEYYRETASPFLKEVPSHWEDTRIGRGYAEKSIGNNDGEQLLSVFLNRGVVSYTDTDMKQVHKPSEDMSSYQLVEPGDFVLNNQQAWRGSVGVSSYRGIVSPAYIVMTPIMDNNPRFMNYMLRETACTAQFVLASKGVGSIQRILSPIKLKSSIMVLPPRAEQDQIVRYLDWQVSKINRLIAVKKRQLSILAEYRKAKIDEIILHGDKQAPQKDSGIWWLRDIPQSWQLIPLKRICQVNASISNTAKQLSDEELVTFLPMESVSTTGTVDYSEKRRLGDVRSGYSSFALDDVVIAKITPCFENGKGACLDSMDTDIGYGTTEFINLRASDRILPRYLYMITMTQPFRKLGEEMMTGSAGQKRVPIEFVKGFAVGIPPIEEQARLLALLNDVTKRIDCQTKSYYESIISLQELRTRLISDVVTGQVDVRGIKVPDDEYINNEITEEEFEETERLS